MHREWREEMLWNLEGNIGGVARGGGGFRGMEGRCRVGLRKVISSARSCLAILEQTCTNT